MFVLGGQLCACEGLDISIPVGICFFIASIYNNDTWKFSVIFVALSREYRQEIHYLLLITIWHGHLNIHPTGPCAEVPM